MDFLPVHRRSINYRMECYVDHGLTYSEAPILRILFGSNSVRNCNMLDCMLLWNYLRLVVCWYVIVCTSLWFPVELKDTFYDLLMIRFCQNVILCVRICRMIYFKTFIWYREHHYCILKIDRKERIMISPIVSKSIGVVEDS